MKFTIGVVSECHIYIKHDPLYIVFQERVQIASQTSSVTDISGLSQNLLEEKNQEIDHLSEQVTRLTTELEELKSDKGVENMVSNLIFQILRPEKTV